jgi:hypothetical protein
MATIDATPGSASFGRIVDISNSPYSHTEAHHCGVDKSGRVSTNRSQLCLRSFVLPAEFNLRWESTSYQHLA